MINTVYHRITHNSTSARWPKRIIVCFLWLLFVFISVLKIIALFWMFHLYLPVEVHSGPSQASKRDLFVRTVNVFELTLLALWISKKVRRQKMPASNSIIWAIFKCFLQFFCHLYLRVHWHFDFISSYKMKYIVEAMSF